MVTQGSFSPLDTRTKTVVLVCFCNGFVIKNHSYFAPRFLIIKYFFTFVCVESGNTSTDSTTSSSGLSSNRSASNVDFSAEYLEWLKYMLRQMLYVKISVASFCTPLL